MDRVGERVGSLRISRLAVGWAALGSLAVLVAAAAGAGLGMVIAIGGLACATVLGAGFLDGWRATQPGVWPPLEGDSDGTTATSAAPRAAEGLPQAFHTDAA